MRLYDIKVIDRVSGEDNFASGLIYSLIEIMNFYDFIEFVAATGCLKLTLGGYFSSVIVEEVLALMTGNVSELVKR